MVLTTTPAHRPTSVDLRSRAERIQTRIDDDRAERLARLAAQAVRHGVQLAPDTIHADLFIAWRDDQPGQCELVTLTTCTCHRFRLWGVCGHQALLLQQMGGK